MGLKENTMKSTPDSKKCKKPSASKEAVRKRVQKYREAKKADGLVRVRISLGDMDHATVVRIAQAAGCTLLDAVTGLVGEYTCKGVLRLPPERGCQCNGNERAELDLMMPKALHATLNTYTPRLTAGEVIEVLIGLKMNPFWNYDEGPQVLGTLLVPPAGAYPYRQMLSPMQAYQFRRERRFLRHVSGLIAKGYSWDEAKECWPDRLDAWGRVSQQERAAYRHAKESGNLEVRGIEVKGYPDLLEIKRRFGVSPWEMEQEDDMAIWDEAERLEAAQAREAAEDEYLEDKVGDVLSAARAQSLRDRRKVVTLEARKELDDLAALESKYGQERIQMPARAPQTASVQVQDPEDDDESWQAEEEAA